MTPHFKFRSILITTVFLAVVSFPLINTCTHLVHDIPNTENRALAREPNLNINRLDPYPAAFETFYNDHFELRSLLLKYYSLFNLVVLKKSPFPDKVIIGNDGWLFLPDESIDCYLGKDRLTASEMEQYRLELEFRYDYLKARHCNFYFMISPCKTNIYPEHLGGLYNSQQGQSWGEQLNEYLNAHSRVKPIDVYDAFRENKRFYQLYYKLDNHWTEPAALMAASITSDRMQKDIGGLTPLPWRDMAVKTEPKIYGNTKEMLGNLDFLYEWENDFHATPGKGFTATDAPELYQPPEYFGDPLGYETRKQRTSKKPKLLIITDSFGASFAPFIAESFGETVKIFGGWDYALNETIVENEKPDAVLLMIHEPIMRNMLDHQARLSHQLKNPTH